MRRWLPRLANFPAKYIYEPWLAPIADQKAAGCVIGVDYPKPIVEHKAASQANMDMMKKAYDAHNGKDGGGAAGGGKGGGGKGGGKGGSGKGGGKGGSGKGGGAAAGKGGGGEAAGKRPMTQQTLGAMKKKAP